MITGFNTDVSYGGCLYHVQTEDRGTDHPFLESLVYVGGTIIAKKLTPYPEDINPAATDDVIAPLLRRQHQVIIAAIRAGRIEELVRHSSDQKDSDSSTARDAGTAAAAAPAQKELPESKPEAPAQLAGKDAAAAPVASQPVASEPAAQQPVQPLRQPNETRPNDTRPAPPAGAASPATSSSGAPEKVVPDTRPAPPERIAPDTRPAPAVNAAGSVQDSGTEGSPVHPVPDAIPPPSPAVTGSTPALSGRLGLNLDQVVSDYLKRSSEQGKLDVKVLSPRVFVAGSSVGVKVQIVRGREPEPDSIVTVKIIGTAFKPQVYMSRADQAGVATFNFSLPAFSAGTAAIVIEAQSNRGRGELKQLIRRA